MVAEEVEGAWQDVRGAIMAWNFDAAADAFHVFCEAHQVPAWFEDEYAFTGMKLWAAGRASSALRHFAMFFDRAAGRPGLWDPADGELLSAAEPLALA